MVYFAPLLLLTLAMSALARPVFDKKTLKRASQQQRRCGAHTDAASVQTTTHHSTTTSAKAAAQTANTISTTKDVFPLGEGKKHWSMDVSIPNHVALNDKNLGVFDNIASLPHPYVEWKGKPAIKSFFPKGSIDPAGNKKGGISFYSHGFQSPAGATEITYAYSVYFEAGFSFNLGGKLPGVYGGDSDEEAIGCSGGSERNNCFSLRMMWRENGLAELYAYLPHVSANTNAIKNVKPVTVVNPNYGDSIGRGAFKWTPGAWGTVAQRVKMNDVGKANAEVEIYFNGKSVINIKGLELRTSSSSTFRGGQYQCFFGGHETEWASPKDQSLYLADMSQAIIS